MTSYLSFHIEKYIYFAMKAFRSILCEPSMQRPLAETVQENDWLHLGLRVTRRPSRGPRQKTSPLGLPT